MNAYVYFLVFIVLCSCENKPSRENNQAETAYELSQNNEFFPLEKILKTNNLLLDANTDKNQLINYLKGEKVLVRFWAALTLQYIEDPSTMIIDALNEAVDDPSQYVRLAAAETLCAHDQCNTSAQEAFLAGLQADNMMLT